jgi:hypothetical protein
MVAGPDAALAEQGRGAAGEGRDAAVLALGEQAAEARVDGEAEHAAAERGESAGVVDGAEAVRRARRLAGRRAAGLRTRRSADRGR